MKRITISTVILLCAVVCSSFAKGNKTANKVIDPLVAHIDKSVKPGTDFFLYANGKWFKENPIPASEQSNGLWQLIQDTIDAQVKQICESSSILKNAAKGSNKQKIGDLFFSGMDSVSLNKNGIVPLSSELAMIDAIKTNDDLIRAVAHIQAIAGSPMFGFGVGQDDKISSKNAVFLSQGGLSLPNRNFYFDTDSRAIGIRAKFAEHVINMFKILGYDDNAAKIAAENVIKLETDMAKVSRKMEDLRDPWSNYNKMTFSALKQSTPNINWDIFIQNVGLEKVDTVIVGQPEFMTAINSFLVTYSIETWKNYLKFNFIRSFARFLDDKTFNESFSFYSTTLRGVPEPKPRWNRVVQMTNSALGELIGQVYVDEYLPKGTKAKLLEIGNSIKSVYAERIKKLDWMSESTKKKALIKLDGIIMKVGYPDKWKDLSSIEIDRNSYVRNIINVNKWEFKEMISKYGKPVDRTEWHMFPQTYNAYYNPSNNEIVVPGCNIIVPGFERKMADDAILYSIIGGSTFGHEITHGFDDQGSKFDVLGNLNNWWTPEDSSKFYAKTKLIVEQFNGYVAVDSLHINGDFTQGENIADLAGVMMGYEAFRKTEQFKKNIKVAGQTPNERYFLGYAFAWMINDRPEAIANQVKSDVHSPAKFRVIGPLVNMSEFYKTFGITDKDILWRPENLRVKIW